MAAPLKGDTALPVVGETVSFVRDPVRFVDARVGRHGPVFVSNLLAAPTVFVCSYDGVKRILHGKGASALATGTAYAEFLGALYPKPNVLLLQTDDERRARLLALSASALDASAGDAFRPVVRRMMQSMLQVMRAHARAPNGQELALYDTFKPLCARISCALVLGERFSAENFEQIRDLCSAHFAGIVAAPLAVRAFGRRTARARALDARSQLARMVALRAEEIRRHGGNDDPCLLSKLLRAANDEDYGLVCEHTLLLLSAAIPKCLASALCSVFMELSNQPKGSMQNDPEYVRAALLEALRLHPPLLGGMRVMEKDGTSVGGALVPCGHRVWWSARHANRDAKAYLQAEEFKPERWRDIVRENRCPFASSRFVDDNSSEKPRIPLTFGAGDRMCTGRFMAWAILDEISTAITKEMQVMSSSRNEKREMRYVPVCRHVDDILVKLRLHDR